MLLQAGGHAVGAAARFLRVGRLRLKLFTALLQTRGDAVGGIWAVTQGRFIKVTQGSSRAGCCPATSAHMLLRTWRTPVTPF